MELGSPANHPKDRTAGRFGENLRAERRALGLSQEALGLVAGVHRTEVSLIERGLREPRLWTLIRLRDALGTELEKLCAGLSDPAAMAAAATAQASKPDPASTPRRTENQDWHESAWVTHGKGRQRSKEAEDWRLGIDGVNGAQVA